MDNSAITSQTLPDYLKPFLKHQLKDIFPPDVTLEVTAVEGGNVNYAFCVSSAATARKVFIKQAPEYVAISGPGKIPLKSQRMKLEADVYREWTSLLGDDLAHEYLPRIFFCDASNMVLCIEFLEGFYLLDKVLVDSKPSIHPEVASKLGDFIGRNHTKTFSSRISPERHKYFQEHYENRPMRDIQLEFVFTKCYTATDQVQSGLNLNDAFMEQIEMLKQQYDGRATSLVLCHGDLHPGSVMVNRQGKIKVIDPEFTVYGPPGLDVGSLLSGFCLGAIHQAYSGDLEATRNILGSAQMVWQSYVHALNLEGVTDADLLNNIQIETVGFAVAEICRTALEFAGDRKWLQLKDLQLKAAAKNAALQLVDNSMINRHSGGITLLWDQLRNVCLINDMRKVKNLSL